MALRAEALQARAVRWPRAASIAGAALLAAGAMGGAYGLLGHWDRSAQGARETPVAATQRYETVVGEIRTIRLADGSDMTLNTDSEVALPAWKGERRVRLLRGEGFFRVAKDAAHPFIVESGGGSVRAVGTAFSVRTDPAGFRVALAEGKVSVSTSVRHDAALLVAGQRLAVKDGAISRSDGGVAQATSWLAGEVTFRDETLGDAIAEMNRYSSRKIVLDDARARGRKLSGVFKTGDIDTFVQALTAYGMARVQSEDAGEIRLSGD